MRSDHSVRAPGFLGTASQSFPNKFKGESVAAPRSVVGENTSVSAGITKAVQVLSQSPYRATRLVIDVSLARSGANLFWKYREQVF